MAIKQHSNVITRYYGDHFKSRKEHCGLRPYSLPVGKAKPFPSHASITVPFDIVCYCLRSRQCRNLCSVNALIIIGFSYAHAVTTSIVAIESP